MPKTRATKRKRDAGELSIAEEFPVNLNYEYEQDDIENLFTAFERSKGGVLNASDGVRVTRLATCYENEKFFPEILAAENQSNRHIPRRIIIPLVSARHYKAVIVDITEQEVAFTYADSVKASKNFSEQMQGSLRQLYRDKQVSFKSKFDGIWNQTRVACGPLMFENMLMGAKLKPVRRQVKDNELREEHIRILGDAFRRKQSEDNIEFFQGDLSEVTITEQDRVVINNIVKLIQKLDQSEIKEQLFKAFEYSNDMQETRLYVAQIKDAIEITLNSELFSSIFNDKGELKIEIDLLKEIGKILNNTVEVKIIEDENDPPAASAHPIRAQAVVDDILRQQVKQIWHKAAVDLFSFSSLEEYLPYLEALRKLGHNMLDMAGKRYESQELRVSAKYKDFKDLSQDSSSENVSFARKDGEERSAKRRKADDSYIGRLQKFLGNIRNLWSSDTASDSVSGELPVIELTKQEVKLLRKAVKEELYENHAEVGLLTTEKVIGRYTKLVADSRIAKDRSI